MAYIDNPKVQEIIKRRKLKPKQAIWCLEMASDATCTNAEAARRAKYKGHNVALARIGYMNARNPNNMEAIAEFKAALGTEFKLTREFVINGLCDLIQLAKDKKDLATVKGCYELLGKTMAIYTDRSQVETSETDALRQQRNEQEQEALRRQAQLRLRSA